MKEEFVKFCKCIAIPMILEKIGLEDRPELTLGGNIYPVNLTYGVKELRLGYGNARRPANAGEPDDCRYHAHLPSVGFRKIEKHLS